MMLQKCMLIQPVLISLLALSVVGCSTDFGHPRAGSPSMSQMYGMANRGDFESTNRDYHPVHTQAVPRPHIMTASDKSRIQSTLESQFPKLKNPQSMMYIFGHYAGKEQLPVPGHFTAFPLYEHNYYALPNEVQTPYNDGQFEEG